MNLVNLLFSPGFASRCLHQLRVAGHYNNQPVPVILHPFQQGIDSLPPEIIRNGTLGKSVRLVDKEPSIQPQIGLPRQFIAVCPR